MEKRFLNIKDACVRYSLGRTKMRQFADEVNGIRKVGRRVLIDSLTVDKAIESQGAKTR